MIKLFNHIISKISVILLVGSTIGLFSCGNESSPDQAESTPNPTNSKLFKELSPSETKVSFINQISENRNFNPVTYEYTYNGGGVAVGDVNADGLDDIFFTANQLSNRLYLNKGSLKFEDVTIESQAFGRRGSWKTGTTMADVNADGLLDIYVCYAGDIPGVQRANELLINQGLNENGIPTFKDEAPKWGVADSAFSTQSIFFDYDKDGDLDMLLINHAPHPYQGLDEASLNYLRKQKNSEIGTKLYQNQGERFLDVTDDSGIDNTSLSFGLGVSVADINNDNWPDIYISNDYMAEDRLYINNTDGTFTDKIQEMISYTSEFSMGNDISDINNDGWNDIYTLDMLPEDNHRQKVLSSIDNYEFFQMRERVGMNAEFMRNMLHVNNKNGNFSEIAQLSGVSNTDWSWSPLFADFDNDGWKDLFVTNGFVHDYTHMDFMKFMGDYLRQQNYELRNENLREIASRVPSSNVTNYIFKNLGDLTFQDMTTDWGINQPSNSNGAAYADFDQDGDLDLVVNNTNQPSAIFRNDANLVTGNHYLQFRLQGESNNTLGVGARIYVYTDGEVQSLEQLVSRGYQSSVSPVLHVGLGRNELVDSLQVIWPSEKTQWLKNIQVDQRINLKESDADQVFDSKVKTSNQLFSPAKNVINYIYAENVTNDFKRQPLLTSALSFNGPCMAKGDFNGDGIEDLFIGGASGKPGKLFRQAKAGSFTESKSDVFIIDARSEDTDARFIDVDNDGDLDLYVASGGYDQFDAQDPALQDRLYLNDGKGLFSKSQKALPQMFTSTGTVASADINNDGYMDFFVGGRVIPGRYPEAPESFLLLNDGNGNYKNVIDQALSPLKKAGMITSAEFADLNNDGVPDLVTAGEFMPIQVWINENGQFTEATNTYFSKPEWGMWNKIILADINSDGRKDIVAGNMGLNTQIKCSDANPVELYYDDFDNNGSVDPILCYYIQGVSYPALARDELLDQIAYMRTRFTSYESYADATIHELFSENELQNAGYLKATCAANTVFVSDQNGVYQKQDLPLSAQTAPIFTIAVLDIDGDQHQDLIMGGNVSNARLKFGYCQASQGLVLKGDGTGSFQSIHPTQSGLQLGGDMRSIMVLDQKVLFGMNDDKVVSYEY